MDKLIKKMEGNAKLLASVQNSETEVTPILQGFITNFPEYTDHSIIHSKTVLGYAQHLLNTEIEKLNEDEAYILIMAGFLHDIGMCPTSDMKKRILESADFKSSGKTFENHLRDIHHKLSYEYITTFWKELKIVNETYAEAIGLVGMGHRKVELLDFDSYNPEFVVKSGSDFVCLPFLAGVLRLADELDITNDRTPELLYNEYFPTNRISKEEWEKHKSNYFVTFNKPSIKITSKCFDKDLYYALLKQYNKIDGVIKYLQKIINTIPQNDRRLKIDYLKLEKDVKTIGFIPKDIGFSFDLQNTINTFIGDNIYKDKFVSIRECLQNAIDSCRYRKQISKSSYSPEITITLSEKELIISDNGLGMDEFIVENYFSKLAKSYYTESKVSKEFEAISQFGIGVFSYFLLCDFFEVESKQEGKECIKFRATKDADNYFHFYPDSIKSSIGTSITIFLKDEMSFDDLIENTKHYIRFVEFPINIQSKVRSASVTSEDFKVDKLEFLGKHIDREYLGALESLEIIDTYINNSECEGNLGLLFSKDSNGIYIPIHNYDTLKTYSTSKIELSQKGIFIGIIRDYTLNNVIGKINLKRKNNIDIGRYHIKDSKRVQEIAGQFYSVIFKKLFENWSKESPKMRTTLTSNLLSYYLESHSIQINHFKDFYNELFFGFYNGKEIEYLPLADILNNEELVIVHDETPYGTRNPYDYSTVADIYQELNKPLILQNRGLPALFLLELFKSQNNQIEIKCKSKNWFFLINTKIASKDEKFLPQQYQAFNFDSMQISAYPGLWLERPFNINHDIIKYYKLNRDKIIKEQRLYKCFDEFFKTLHSFTFNIHSTNSPPKNPTEEVDYINSLLEKVNSVHNTNFVLSSKDFAPWISKKIRWKTN
jgi:molecular chaperone HtpG